ncbi:MAG: hypothetical protein Q4G36_03325 [Paracoccus sp. (in: a-proteobacteria)]|nr:hypothetical protein [Paracoccus sp. (in: a-proteobacteria)]
MLRQIRTFQTFIQSARFALQNPPTRVFYRAWFVAARISLCTNRRSKIRNPISSGPAKLIIAALMIDQPVSVGGGKARHGRAQRAAHEPNLSRSAKRELLHNR